MDRRKVDGLPIKKGDCWRNIPKDLYEEVVCAAFDLGTTTQYCKKGDRRSEPCHSDWCNDCAVHYVLDSMGIYYTYIDKYDYDTGKLLVKKEINKISIILDEFETHELLGFLKHCYTHNPLYSLDKAIKQLERKGE